MWQSAFIEGQSYERFFSYITCLYFLPIIPFMTSMRFLSRTSLIYIPFQGNTTGAIMPNACAIYIIRRWLCHLQEPNCWVFLKSHHSEEVSPKFTTGRLHFPAAGGLPTASPTSQPQRHSAHSYLADVRRKPLVSCSQPLQVSSSLGVYLCVLAGKG
jgi:hypothetical protein